MYLILYCKISEQKIINDTGVFNDYVNCIYDEELNDMIAKAAETIDRSKAYVVRKAVRAYLENNSIAE